jgi:hypothetical protein
VLAFVRGIVKVAVGGVKRVVFIRGGIEAFQVDYLDGAFFAGG